jgi:hypothetical protein
MTTFAKKTLTAAVAALSIGAAFVSTSDSAQAQDNSGKSASAPSGSANAPPPPPEISDQQNATAAANAVAAIPDDWRQTLGSSGEFIQHPKYGEVWKPTVTPPGWHPYPACFWTWTKDQGWYFDDPSAWGKIVHHYGRWANDADHGWVWVPGTEYSAGWVTWSTSEKFIGWAPKVPEQDEATTSIDQFNKSGKWIFMDAKKFGKKCGAPCTPYVKPSRPIVVPPPAVIIPPPARPGIIIPFCESNPFHPRCDYRTFCEKYPRHRHCEPRTFCERFPRHPKCDRYCPPGREWRRGECVRIPRICPPETRLLRGECVPNNPCKYGRRRSDGTCWTPQPDIRPLPKGDRPNIPSLPKGVPPNIPSLPKGDRPNIPSIPKGVRPNIPSIPKGVRPEIPSLRGRPAPPVSG